MLSLICAWMNGWVNNREAGDLRRHPAHYDVTVMRHQVIPDPYLTITETHLKISQIHRFHLQASHLQIGDINLLTHWGRVMHICMSKLNIIGSDNGLSPARYQAIIWTNDVLLSPRPYGMKFYLKFKGFHSRKYIWKCRLRKWRPFCLGLNVLRMRGYRDSTSSNGCQETCPINSLAPGKFEWNFRHVIFKQILVIDDWCFSCEIALTWKPQDLAYDKSTLVQVMAWCHQATSHYLSQCWPSSLSPYVITRPQWVHSLRPSDARWQQRSGSTLAQIMAIWHQCIRLSNHHNDMGWWVYIRNAPGSAFIKADQHNPWIKDQLGNALLSTISHLQLPNFVSCGRDKPSHMTQNLVTVGAKL